MGKYVDSIVAAYRGEEGVVGGYKYWSEMGEPGNAGQPYCCTGACWASRKADKDIGLWTSCSELKENRGIQWYFANSGHYKKVSLANAKRGDFAIMNFRTDGKLEYSHICLFDGERDSQGRYKTYNFNVSNTNGVRWYPASQFQVIWHPDYDDEPVKNGWVKESGGYRYYDNGTMVKNDWKQGKDKYAERWFYLGADGAIVKACIKKINGNYYGFAANGVMLANCGRIYKGSLYVFGTDGKCSAKYKVTAESGIDGAYIVTK